MYTNTDVLPPSARAEYDAWYRRVHFGEVLAPGIFDQATMLHNAVDPPPDGEGHFLAYYESSRGNVARVAAEFASHVAKLFADRRIHGGTSGRHFGIYSVTEQRTADPVAPYSNHTHAMLVEHLDQLGSTATERAAALFDGGAFHTVTIAELAYGMRSFSRLSTDDGSREADIETPVLVIAESDRGDPARLGNDLAPNAPAGRRSFFYRAC